MIIYCEIKEDFTEGLTVRGRRNVLRANNLAIAQTWEAKYLRLHFSASAGRKYGYKNRTRKWLRRKRQLAAQGKVLYGGTRDLVATGRLERAMQSRQIVSATPAFSKVRLIGPNYFRIRYRPGRPNLGEEVTTVVESEKRWLLSAGVAAAEKELRTNKRVRRTKTR